MKTRFFASATPRFFAHRGSSAHYPENTIPSFEAALKAGVTYLEMDVWATHDGHVVVHHDETVKRLCGVDKKVSELTLDELKSLDAGYNFSLDNIKSHPFRAKGITIPTLEEVLTTFPQALFNIEIKQDFPAIEFLTLEVIRRSKKEDAVLLAAEKDIVMKRIREICYDIPTSMSIGEIAEFFNRLHTGCMKGYKPPGKALQIPENHGRLSLVTNETVKAAHAVGLEVHVWTINEQEDMQRLLETGVDGIMSDFPELLVEVQNSKI